MIAKNCLRVTCFYDDLILDFPAVFLPWLSKLTVQYVLTVNMHLCVSLLLICHDNHV